MVLFIPIGGNCSFAIVLRKQLKLSETALPFDYIRCNFQCIVECIMDKFANFLPNNSETVNTTDESAIYVNDYDHYISENVKQYNFKNHSFWHHNLGDKNVIESFNRRIARFLELLLSTEELVFVRLITAPTIIEEVDYRFNFFAALRNINPNLNYKLILIGANQQNIFKYKFIDDKTSLIITSANYIESLNKCILFIIKHGFLISDFIFDNNSEIITETTINLDDDEYKSNLCRMDIHIH